MKQMGIFYNSNFDTINIVLNDEKNEHINNYYLQARHIEPKIVEITYNHEIVGYNLLEASKEFAGNELVNGINSDNVQVRDMVIKALTKFNPKLNEYNATSQFIVGKVIVKEKHPKSDHLSVCLVDVGSKKLQIVCGAPNVAPDQFVVVAMVGAVMPNDVKILPNVLLGVNSDGMLCSSVELGLPSDGVKGIMLLDSSKYKVGNSFFGGYYGWQN